MDSYIPKLRSEVNIDEFDDADDKKSYILYYQERHWKVSEIVYWIYESMDGYKTVAELKEHIYLKYGLNINKSSFFNIINKVFIDNGLLEGYKSKNVHKSNSMIWGKITLLKPKWVQKFAFMSIFFNKKAFYPLGLLAIISQLYLMLIVNDDVIKSMMASSLQGGIFILGFLVFSTFIHEIGHSAACMNYKIEPGRIGAGFYFIMPVFFTDITKVWRIKRKERFVVDIGGMYFTSLFLCIVYMINSTFIKEQYINLAIILASIQNLFNLNPFIKMDGYWALSDLLGIPNLLNTIKQIFINIYYKIRGQKDKIKDEIKNRRYKFILYVYSCFGIIFMGYFTIYLFKSFTVAVNIIHGDIQNINLEGVLKFNDIYNYISLRYTSFIAIIFFLRTFWVLSLRKIWQLVFVKLGRVKKGDKNE